MAVMDAIYNITTERKSTLSYPKYKKRGLESL